MLTEAEKKELRLARAAINEFLPSIAESAEKANAYAPVMLAWQAGTAEKPVSYGLDDLRQENGVPYRCTVAHTHGGEPGWNPSAGTALWRRYHGTSPETAWEFTADGANPYKMGEYCLENGQTYRCIADSTVYAPSVYPGHWEVAA